MYRNEMSVTKTLQLAWGVVASAAIAWSGGSTAQAGEPDTPVAHKVVSDAVSRAVAHVNNPILTSLREAKPNKMGMKAITLAQAR
jgi:hypothetical protein